MVAIFGMVRGLVSLALLGGFLLFGATVPLGERTLFQHVARIWDSKETQDLVDGVKESSKPVVDRVSRGVKAGMDAMSDEDAPSDAGTDAKKQSPEEGVRDKVKNELAERAGDAAKDATKKAVAEEIDKVGKP